MILSIRHAEALSGGTECGFADEHDDVHARFTEDAVDHRVFMVTLRASSLLLRQTGRQADTLAQRVPDAELPVVPASRRRPRFAGNETDYK